MAGTAAQGSGSMTGSIVLTSLSVFLGLFFVFVGCMKLTPNINREMHREIRRCFVNYAKVFPTVLLFNLKMSPQLLRLIVGWTEVGCGTTLLLIPGHVKQLANVIILVLCLGAIYTHAMLRDPFERMAPALFFSLLLTCRLVVFYQVRKRSLSLAKAMSRRGHDESTEYPREQLPGPSQEKTHSAPTQTTESPTAAGGRKDSKKNNKKKSKKDD